MSSSVKSITINYNPVNEHKTFSNGDVLAGWVVVVILKETKIETLLVKARGKVEVYWTEQFGVRMEYYSASEKCLKLDQILLSKKKNEDNIVLAPGKHVYPFKFQIPNRSMPSTFKGAHGSVEYKLEVKLSRSWRIPFKVKSAFTFLEKIDQRVHQIMKPQNGTVTKKFNVFTSGNATMTVSLDKSGFRQGTRIKISMKVDNSTSRDITPKFFVTQKQSFFARGSRKFHKNKVLKMTGKPIPSKSQQTLVEMLTIPPNLPVSILNCRIIKVEYKLRVYLDVSYAIDPELKIPFVVLPADYGFLRAANPNPSAASKASGDSGINECKKNPPPTAPGSASPSAPAMIPPQPLPSGFLPPNSEAVPPPYAEAAVPQPQTDPLPPPSYTPLSIFPPQSGPGMFPPPIIPGVLLPYTAFGQFPAQTAQGAPPPYTAFGQFPTQAAQGAPPPYCDSGETEPQPGPGAHSTRDAPGSYPSLSKSGEKVPL